MILNGLRIVAPEDDHYIKNIQGIFHLNVGDAINDCVLNNFIIGDASQDIFYMGCNFRNCTFQYPPDTDKDGVIKDTSAPHPMPIIHGSMIRNCHVNGKHFVTSLRTEEKKDEGSD